MMMNTGNWEANALGYTTVEMLLDDVSKQMASSNISRWSRGSNGQKTAGSIRVAKPNSASNSPRSSIGLGRRRTVMTDGAHRRRLVMMDQNLVAAGGLSIDGPQMPNRSTRPVSWHPVSHLAPQQPLYLNVHPVPPTDLHQQFQFDSSQSPAVYSGYTSPSSTFSPLSMPYSGYEQPQYSYQNPSTSVNTNTNISTTYPVNQTQFIEQPASNLVSGSVGDVDPSMYSHFDWNNFAVNGFESSTTAPPTPENFLPIQHPEPTFPAEESIPYHPLSDEEDDSEELIGMGLYDTPETTKSSLSDPQLDNYRALMISQLFGPSYRKAESTGKGLKLEETWNPPASDDGEDDDDDQDGEGEDDDELEAQPEKSAEQSKDSVSAMSQQHVATGGETSAVTQSFDRPGWF